MRLLLDTHVAIWAIDTPERIPEHIHLLLREAYPNVFVSAAAVWEIAIKHPLGRSDAPPVSGYQAMAEFEAAGFALLDVSAAHAAFVERLPLHHGDPFDRLMLAQAIVEGMQFVTYDRHLSRYDVALLTWS
ncbi:MAG: type II toxin-antitoxin system VapC family toxin [Aquamicrobium sp.]|uniref:type II toxin-antitoxin system VapC family toxin n=1 Tax=Aquamicrobium sp. TaxID=1872579 RepID=UPI00349E5271|nr:type II toxin-antitoxin system VapC family toxin [Aquamicrobium sp.]